MSAGAWLTADQRDLLTGLAEVRVALDRHRQRAEDDAGDRARPPRDDSQAQAAATAEPSALARLCRLFGLSPFERAILLLCAGIELDSTFAPQCAAAQGDPGRSYPTFSLALAALPEPHWSALSPASPLRRWRLIEVGAGHTLTLSPLRIDERVLHYLAGVEHLDERLSGIVEPLRGAPELVPSHRALADRLVAAWTRTSGRSTLSAVHLGGDEGPAKRGVAAAACAALGLQLSLMSAHAVPAGPAELDALVRLWTREAALGASALLLDCDDTIAIDPARETAIAWLIERVSGPLIVASRERWRTWHRPMLTLEVRKPTAGEQRSLWQDVLSAGGLEPDGQVDALVSQFSLGAAGIRAAGAEVLGRLPSRDSLGHLVWDACRAQARPRLDDLAQRIEPAARWEDLVLPESQRSILRAIATHVRQRVTVYEAWGFAGKGSRGLGIGALFTGVTGTGKTMAAEVLANELRLDLYRIDLSQVVSKYIGETEKNLRRVFDAAEAGGAILLFDEADALFGKRSEVRDSHDRYANIEVSYLLQRMEAYRGLAILTTNMKSALDPAFLRRLRFIVQFPFPDAAQRAQIWRRIFPPEAPTDGLDVARLARLNVAGGNIRNIALAAAFLAADAAEPVRMAHLFQAARSEYAKLEQPLTEAEIGGWR